MPASATVVGAGIAGLACALELAEAGLAVTVLDKGRHPGGRVAARHIGDLVFNHGAQFATARAAPFAQVLQDLQDEGCAARWPQAGGKGQRISFAPDMSALPRALAQRAGARGVRILQERQASYLHAHAQGWQVRHHGAAQITPGATQPDGGDLGPPMTLVCIALPPLQAAALLGTAGHPFAAEVGQARMAPCWAVMAGFATRLDLPDTLELPTASLAWFARENSRPGNAEHRPVLQGQHGAQVIDHWTLHATATWSNAHLEDAAPRVIETLLAEFLPFAQAPDTPVPFAQAHRWRYALVEQALGQSCLWDGRARLGACGDWCLGGRLEAAYDSGQALARAALATLA